MGTIAQELITFKNSVAGKTDGMSSKCDEIVSKVQQASNACNSAKAGVSSYYKSKNASIILGTFDNLNNEYKKIESSVNSTLKSMVSKSQDLLNDVIKLEEINKIIEENQQIANNNNQDTDEAKTRKNNALNVVNQKESEFTELHTQALAKLSALCSMDDDLSGNSSGSSETKTTDNNTSVSEIKTTGGSFKEASYKASNGVTVNYYIYVPEVEETTKLPMLIYFHGVQDTLKKAPERGLGGLINTGEIEPKGIVILPQAINGTKDIDFCTANYEKAVLELTDKVAEEYNGDLNRLSVSGHSNGGTAAYKIVNNFPGRFAACAPIAGVGNTEDGITKTSLWAFQGSNDSLVKQSTGLRVAIRCQKMGCDSKYYVYRGKGHDIQTLTYQDEFDDGTGKKVKLIDWLMSQTLNS